MAQSVGEQTGVNSTLGIAPKTEDFVKQAAISDMFEIESSKIAQERGHADQKVFAGTMIKDHETTSADLMARAGAWKTALPTQLDSAHLTKIDELKSSSVKYPEAVDWQWKLRRSLRLDLPGIRAGTLIILQIEV